MSLKQPIIQFSPFEALLIGEKNKILKRQPMKNTIFVTILNQHQKDINLRDLFGLEKNSTKAENKDVVFKMPQRVRDFLKTRRLKGTINNTRIHEKENLLCYEFEGQEMFLKSSESLKPNGKKTKLKLRNIKFKKKFKYKENIKEKIAKKFPLLTHKSFYQENPNNISQSFGDSSNKLRKHKRHSLRGKDGKFIPKSSYENTMTKKVGHKEKYLLNFMPQVHAKKAKRCFRRRKKKKIEISETHNLLNKVKFRKNLPYKKNRKDQTAYINNIYDLLKNNCRNNCLKDFKFPTFPNQSHFSYFEDSENLSEIIYENFPQQIKFNCKEHTEDFSEALKNADILKAEEILKVYEKKENGFSDNSGVMVVFNGHIPYIKLNRLDNLKNCHFKNLKNISKSITNEPSKKKNQIITAQNIGNVFFQSVEKKDIFIRNLVKPFLHNSWFGSISDY